MYTIAICDNEGYYIQKIEQLILQCYPNEEFSFLEFHSQEKLLQTPFYIDILILDIPFYSSLYTSTPRTIVISPYHYLLKYVQTETALLILQELLTGMMQRNRLKKLLVRCGSEYLSLPNSDITYFSKHRQGSEVHLCSDSDFSKREHPPMYPKTLKELAELLHPYHFSLSHNHYLVHLDYVTAVSPKTNSIMIEQECLTLARFKQQDFLHDFSEYTQVK